VDIRQTHMIYSYVTVDIRQTHVIYSYVTVDIRLSIHVGTLVVLCLLLVREATC